MRIRYSFTTDLEDAFSAVEFHMNKYAKRNSLDSSIKAIIEKIKVEDPDLLEALEDIDALREDLAKLDMLLAETTEIFKACVSATLPEAADKEKELLVEEQENTAAHEVKLPESTGWTIDDTREQLKKSKEYRELQKGLAQIGEFAQNLNRMRKQDAEKIEKLQG